LWFWFALGSAVYAALTSIEAIYQPYIDGEKEINAEYNAPFVRGEGSS
jgi:hypothetical protein